MQPNLSIRSLLLFSLLLFGCDGSTEVSTQDPQIEIEVTEPTERPGVLEVPACRSLTPTLFVDGSSTGCNGAPCADGNDGKTPETALATIAEAVSRVQPGDTVFVADGLYRLRQVSFSKKGTTSAPITFCASGDAVMFSGAQPTDETEFSKTSGYSNVYEISYSNLPEGSFDSARQFVSQLDGFTAWLGYRSAATRIELQANFFQRVSSLAELDRMPKGSYADDSADRLYIHTSDGGPPSDHEIEIVMPFFARGITFTNASYVTFEGFQIRHGGFWMTESNDHITLRNIEAISSLLVAGTSLNDHDNVIENVWVHDGLYGVAEKVDVNTGAFSSGHGCCDVWVRGTRPTLRNAIVEEMWNAVATNGSVDAMVENCLFRDNPNHSTYVNVGDTNFTIRNSVYARNQDTLYIDGAKDTQFYNNTMDGVVIFQSTKSGVIPTGTVIMNNIMIGHRLSNTDPIDPTGTGDVVYADFIADYNLFLPEGGYDQSSQMEVGKSTAETLAEWQARTSAFGKPQDVNSREIDGSALFVDWPNDDFTPIAGALSIDMGTDLLPAPLSTDYNGNVRPVDGNGDAAAQFDAGAIEYRP